MARSKKKPVYNSQDIMNEFISAVAECFGRSYDDRERSKGDYPSLNMVAAEFDITALKARKILITAGCYSTVISRKIADLYSRGMSIEEIMGETGLSRASVHSYLPYTKNVYRLEELSTNAERTKLYRDRKAVCQRLYENKNETVLWEAILLFQNYPFCTCGRGKRSGVKFTYKIKERRDGRLGGEMAVNRKEKTITQSSVFVAYRKALEMEGMVNGPKKLGVFGASYLYPVFIRLGVIK